MGDINVFKGDCLDIMDEMIKEGIRVDTVITDPPYKIETTGAGMYKQKDKQYVKELENIKDGFSEKVLDRLCRIQNKINMYFFCSQKQILPLLKYFVEGKKCNYNLLTWHKTNPVPACGNKYLTDTEFILFFRQKGVKILGEYKTKFTYYVSPLNQKDKKIYKHPTIKPEELINRFVQNSSATGETVFDPFMGSGTTGVACVNTGRKFIGVELNEDYFNIASKRISDALTKKELF